MAMLTFWSTSIGSHAGTTPGARAAAAGEITHDFGRVSFIDEETSARSHYQKLMPPLPDPAGMDGPFKCLEPAQKHLFQNGR